MRWRAASGSGCLSIIWRSRLRYPLGRFVHRRSAYHSPKCGSMEDRQAGRYTRRPAYRLAWWGRSSFERSRMVNPRRDAAFNGKLPCAVSPENLQLRCLSPLWPSSPRQHARLIGVHVACADREHLRQKQHQKAGGSTMSQLRARLTRTVRRSSLKRSPRPRRGIGRNLGNLLRLPALPPIVKQLRSSSPEKKDGSA